MQPPSLALPSIVPQELAHSHQRLFIIRHAETDYNARNIVQGSGIDSHLNATGKAQAASFYAAYGTVPFQAIYCSALQRSRQTLEPFEKAGYAVRTVAGLNEMSWGVLEGMTHDSATEAYFKQTLAVWAAGDADHSVEGGESPNEVAQRAMQALREIILTHPTGNLLICTHGRTLRILLCQLLGYGLQHMQWFRHSNVALNLVIRSGTKFYVEKLNDLAHLA